jgi:hypothetical protein
VFCPRCGTENAADNRYCVSCGHQLGARAEVPAKGLGERVRDVFGRSRKELLITAGTLAAILVAVVSLISLDPDEVSDDDEPVAPPEADAACVEAKEAVARAATTAGPAEATAFQSYAAELIAAMLEFRRTVRESGVSGEAATELDASLRDAAIEAGGLARLAREGEDRAALVEQASRIEDATTRADEAIEQLGLTTCAEIRIVPASAPGEPNE